MIDRNPLVSETCIQVMGPQLHSSFYVGYVRVADVLIAERSASVVPTADLETRIGTKMLPPHVHRPG